MDPGATVLAVDIGGTKLAAGLVDAGGRVEVELRVPTPRGGDAETVWSALAELVAMVLGDAGSPGPRACGVGCAGPLTGTGVSPLNIPAWRGFSLRERVEVATGLATWVDLDTKVLALAEGWCGAAVGVDDYLAMVVSTGIGGGIVLDGRLLHGRSGNAGHIGHIVVEPDGHPCACGSWGCLEAEASGTALLRQLGTDPRSAPLAVRRRTGTLVGRAVASVANLLDLQLATVAGSVALGFGAPFFEAAQLEIDARARLAYASGCRIVPGGLAERGPLVGAAALAWRALGHGVGPSLG